MERAQPLGFSPPQSLVIEIFSVLSDDETLMQHLAPSSSHSALLIILNVCYSDLDQNCILITGLDRILIDEDVSSFRIGVNMWGRHS